MIRAILSFRRGGFADLHHVRCARSTFTTHCQSFGRPHHEIVAEFTSATLEHFPVDNGEAFNKTMKANTATSGKPVRWWGWGAPEGHSLDDNVITFWVPHPDD
jgi:hypothetical protein